ncbi:MAG: hypothetical protein ACI9G1_000034 [Pirellulaceae bacterium]
MLADPLYNSHNLTNSYGPIAKHVMQTLSMTVLKNYELFAMTDNLTPHHPSLPPIKQTSIWHIIAIVGVLSFISVGFIVGVVAYYAYSGESLPTSSAEKRIVVTASDAQQFLANLVVRHDAETITKTRYPDGSISIDYSYSHPQDDAQLMINCQVTIYKSVFEAEEAFALQSRLTNWTLGEGTLEKQDWFTVGDESYFATVHNAEGAIVGNYFTYIQGDRVFSLQIYGIGFEDAIAMNQLIGPVYNAIEAYSPE